MFAQQSLQPKLSRGAVVVFHKLYRTARPSSVHKTESAPVIVTHSRRQCVSQGPTRLVVLMRGNVLLEYVQMNNVEISVFEWEKEEPGHSCLRTPKGFNAARVSVGAL